MAATFTNLLYHIIFSTKDREPLISPAVAPELHKYIGGILRNHGGTLLEIGGSDDHVHVVVRLKAETSVSDMVRLIKANSSKWAHERQIPFEWQIGYGAFTVSESQLPAVIDYVRRQPEHHQARSFKDEFVAMLQRHGLRFDSPYIWS